MLRTLWVSAAQVIAAVVVTMGCFAAAAGAASSGSDSYDDNWEGFEYVLAALVLVPLGAMIAGVLVAKKLRLASWGSFALSVIAVVVVMSFDLWNPGFFSLNLPLALLALVGVNLLLGYTAGMRRDSPDRD